MNRIYVRGRKFALFAPEPILNPATGRATRWHVLCPVDQGREKAEQMARAILSQAGGGGDGDVPRHMATYEAWELARREKRRPADPQRQKMHAAGSRELARQCRVISDAFGAFDVAQIEPQDVAAFVDQWEGRRMAKIYHGRLSAFFAWACRKGLRADNPAREIRTERTERRARYVTDAEFRAIREAMALGEDGRRTASGAMMQAFLDLLYLTMQRPTEIRLLRWDQVDEMDGHIKFRPTKTDRSSGASVAVPITLDITEALRSARLAGGVKSLYVIHTLQGQPYSVWGISSAWRRACERAGVAGATTRDIRAKAITDARRAGYSLDDLKIAAAHTDARMTGAYVKQAVAPASPVRLKLPG